MKFMFKKRWQIFIKCKLVKIHKKISYMGSSRDMHCSLSLKFLDTVRFKRLKYAAIYNFSTFWIIGNPIEVQFKWKLVFETIKNCSIFKEMCEYKTQGQC